MNMRSSVFGLVVIALCWCAPFASADAKPASCKAGLASVKITPREPVRLAGYASRRKPFKGVALDLYAKALALEDAKGNRAVLVTADVIGFRASFSQSVSNKITEKTGLKRHQILLNASHTHTGPILALNAKDLSLPAEQAKATARYTQQLHDQLVELVAQSLKKLAPAQLSWATGVAPFVMNRREFTTRGVKLGVNARGLADRSVPVLRIESPEGKLRGVLFGTACHNTTLTGKHLQISGDYAGYAQGYIEAQYPGVQAMFMQGCGGDANPYPRGSEELARVHGMVLGKEVARMLETKLQPVSGSLRVELKEVKLPLAPPLKRETLAEMERARGWRGYVARKMKAILDTGKKFPKHYSAPIAVWQFGESLTLVALPGEVVVDYVSLLEKALGPNRLWIAAYSNDVFGYLPSARVLKEGGYETRGLISGGVGFFSPEAQQVVVREVRALAAKVGRPGVK